ncbi:hypothetical protein NM688_g4860 [Phlebia brevispora]|uniref:Uncharacterized protein n=1 Tax=Phlebia brevispora TaxID=194682 RepID=A0ACC1T1R2_9APHY|nr:hypothetical protein NM688_g4860 [Phlebia brevispora]
MENASICEAASHPTSTPSLPSSDVKAAQTAHESSAMQMSGRGEPSDVRSLPNNILARVFFLLMMLTIEEHYPEDPSLCYDWLTVTAVCRRWNTVAMQTPNLWSRIFIPTNEAFLELLLERSGDALLYVSYDDNDFEDVLACLDTLELVLNEHSHRIRDLFLSIDPEAYEEIQGELHHPMSHLRTWHMCTNTDGEFPEAYLDHGNMPALQVFRNAGHYTVPWNSLSSMSTLRVLDLAYDSRDETVTLSTILNILNGMPLLQRLRLVDLITSVDTEPRPIMMYHLEDCEIVSTPTFCATLLQYLRTPSEMRLLIRYTTVETADSDYALLLSPILTKLSGATTLSPPSPLTSFGVSITEAGEFCGWRTPIGFEDPSSSGFVDVCAFRLQIPSCPKQLAEFIKPLPLQDVQVLRMYIPSDFPDDSSQLEIADLALLSTCMPNVNTLVCSGGTSQIYSMCLCKSHGTIPGNGLAWPSLATLVMQNVSFSFRHGHKYDSDKIEELRKGLQDRQSRGCAPLDRLYIRRSVIKESDLDMLTDCAKAVIEERNTHPPSSR